jgi:hypothetical protein
MVSGVCCGIFAVDAWIESYKPGMSLRYEIALFGRRLNVLVESLQALR